MSLPLPPYRPSRFLPNSKPARLDCWSSTGPWPMRASVLARRTGRHRRGISAATMLVRNLILALRLRVEMQKRIRVARCRGVTSVAAKRCRTEARSSMYRSSPKTPDRRSRRPSRIATHVSVRASGTQCPSTGRSVTRLGPRQRVVAGVWRLAWTMGHCREVKASGFSWRINAFLDAVDNW